MEQSLEGFRIHTVKSFVDSWEKLGAPNFTGAFPVTGGFIEISVVKKPEVKPVEFCGAV